ncbi:MAG: putative colanic acid biosynthesis acetyltransferase [Coprobacter sp.]|nr:putative colanic acid biosynthesis acetyltransferase [Coprobacter sp.]
MEFNPVQTTPYSVGYKIKSRLWAIVNSTLFRWTPFFMRKTRVAILRLFGANVDWSCSIRGGAEIIDPWNLSMGALSSIDKECCIRCRGKVMIGEKCCISQGVNILTGTHNITSPNFEMITAPVTIEDNVWVATNAIIGKGVTIGKGAVIGAGAVVTKDVESWTVVGGNPAKFIKKRVIKNA